MSFRLAPKSVTLNDLEQRNGRYFALFQRIRVASVAHCVKVHVRYLIMTSSCVLLQSNFTKSSENWCPYAIVWRCFRDMFSGFGRTPIVTQTDRQADRQRN